MTFRTVGDLTSDLRQRCDLRGQELRHPDADLRRALTQSLRAARSMMAEYYIEPSDPDTLPTSAPIASEQFLEVAWPSTAVEIHGVDILVSGRWYALEPVPFAARRDYQSLDGKPRAFRVRSLPKETPAAALTAGVIQIYPLSTEGLTYRIWFVAELPELTNPAHYVQGHNGDVLEWALWDATIKLATEDSDSQEVIDRATTERAAVAARIMKALSRVERSGPIVPRRSRGYR